MEQEPMPTDPKGQPPYSNYLRYSGFAFQLLGGIGLGAWVGFKLDKYFGLKFPLFLLLFIVVILAGMLYQISKRFNKD